MITKEQIPHILGHTAYDRTHKKLGEIGQVFIDDVTGEPEWLTVRTGFFGTRETFVPARPAELQGEEVMVPFAQDQVKEAPRIDAETGRVPPEDETRLYDFYGMRPPPHPGTEPATPPVAHADEGATDQAMTRAEEHLRVGKEQREAGRARLRKYVVTDYEEHTVPVRREEVRVEREPITAENIDQAMAGPEISEDEHEVVLHEERPVVAKETVPVERVRLEKETVVEEETVGGEVRTEHIEAEGTEPPRTAEDEQGH